MKSRRTMDGVAGRVRGIFSNKGRDLAITQLGAQGADGGSTLRIEGQKPR
jgi:hypothetical protein